MVTLNRIVALAMVRGPMVGLAGAGRRRTGPGRALTASPPSARTCSNSPATPMRAQHYLDAARGTLNLPERRYLEAREARLAAPLVPATRRRRPASPMIKSACPSQHDHFRLLITTVQWGAGFFASPVAAVWSWSIGQRG